MTDEERRPRRVVISNVYPDDNRGSAALTSAAIDAARAAFPDCRVSLVAVAAGQIERAYRHTGARYPEVELLPPPILLRGGPLDGLRGVIRSFRVLLLPPAKAASATIHRILEADLIISRGGFVFVDQGNLRGLFSLWLTAFPLVLGSRFGIPTVAYGTTVGPLEQRPTKILVRWILRQLTLVLVRGPRSYREAISLGLAPGRVIEMPDSVFGAMPPDRDRRVAVARRFGLRERRFGVVTVLNGRRSRHEDHLFLQALAATIRDLLQSGLLDRMAVVVQVDGTLVSDAAASFDLAGLVNDDRLTVIREDLRPEDLIALYGAASVVIGARLHSAIFSLIAGTPAFVIAMQGTKSKDVFESLGLERFVIRSSAFNPPAVAASVREVVTDGESFRSELRVLVSEKRARVQAAASLLKLAAAGTLTPGGPPLQIASTERGNGEA